MWGIVAAVLFGFDGVSVEAELSKRRSTFVDDRRVEVGGYVCTSPLQLVDIAALVDDDVWEQAMEYGLRKKLVTLAELEGVIDVLSRSRVQGLRRIRRVLQQRPPGALRQSHCSKRCTSSSPATFQGSLLPCGSSECSIAMAASSHAWICAGPNSACSSNSTAGTTRASRSTTRAVKRRSSRRPGGCVRG